MVISLARVSRFGCLVQLNRCHFLEAIEGARAARLEQILQSLVRVAASQRLAELRVGLDVTVLGQLAQDGHRLVRLAALAQHLAQREAEVGLPVAQAAAAAATVHVLLLFLQNLI
ncbi:hypothetical protein LLEC1_04524 [Akanthomyces lecanii]|uniref:Uncharacterized protein n=1 Tax=Cordyceps confragosa TaxID=2714763 RepID=A0A179IAT6_CORDF|nr:hypothetical protein LLEC1_04524 [Akanthomyces lecanii]